MNFIHDFEVELNKHKKKYAINFLKSKFDIETIEFLNNRLIIHFNSEYDKKAIQKSFEELEFILNKLEIEVKYSNENDCKFNDEIYYELIHNKEIIKIEDGVFVYQNHFLKAMNLLIDYLKKKSNELDCKEIQLPNLWNEKLLNRLNYFKDFPKKNLKIENDKVIMNSSICNYIYYINRDSQIINKRYFSYGKCYRNEAKFNSLERLKEFTMFELVFLVYESEIQNLKEKLFCIMTEIIEKLELFAYIETAYDSFFSNDYSLKNIFQLANETKLELNVKINKENKKIAVASLNNHMNFFAEKFNISNNSDEKLHSMCLAFGIERFVFSLFSQFGIKESIEKLEKLNVQ